MGSLDHFPRQGVYVDIAAFQDVDRVMAVENSAVRSGLQAVLVTGEQGPAGRIR